MIPCAGQGALGIEVRSESAELIALLKAMTDEPTWLATQAERAVSRALGGSCSMPLAAHAQWLDGDLVLDAALGDGERAERPLLKTRVRAAVRSTDEAKALGEQAADALRERGAADYLPPPAPAC
jgi:hydroxymethylbilane synthase